MLQDSFYAARSFWWWSIFKRVFKAFALISSPLALATPGFRTYFQTLSEWFSFHLDWMVVYRRSLLKKKYFPVEEIGEQEILPLPQYSLKPFMVPIQITLRVTCFDDRHNWILLNKIWTTSYQQDSCQVFRRLGHQNLRNTRFYFYWLPVSILKFNACFLYIEKNAMEWNISGHRVVTCVAKDLEN